MYTYSIVPGTIYGLASGRFIELGIQNPHSIQIPLLIRAGIARGHAGMVGKGVNLWPNAHVDDGMYPSFPCYCATVIILTTFASMIQSLIYLSFFTTTSLPTTKIRLDTVILGTTSLRTASTT